MEATEFDDKAAVARDLFQSGQFNEAAVIVAELRRDAEDRGKWLHQEGDGTLVVLDAQV